MTIENIQKQVLGVTDLVIRGLGEYSNNCRSELVRIAAANALRWLALNAPPELLDGSDETDESNLLVDASSMTPVNGVYTMPSEFVRIARVRSASWHKAVGEALYDTSDSAMMLEDSIAAATNDRPVVVLKNAYSKKMTIHPYVSTESVEIFYVQFPMSEIDDLLDYTQPLTTKIPMPPKVIPAFIYQTAGYLLLSMRDGDAKAFFETAKSLINEAIS